MYLIISKNGKDIGHSDCCNDVWLGKIGEWAGPDYFPPFGGERRFRNMCGRLMRNGEIPFTFGLSGLKILIRRHRTKSKDQPQLALDYDGREIFEQQYRESAALDINGVPIVDSNIDEWDGVHAYACPATEQAKSQIYGASIRMLKEYGVIMQQADQVLGGGTSECYNFGHGHPPGRGIWQIESLKKYMMRLEKTQRKFLKILHCHRSGFQNHLFSIWIFTIAEIMINLRAVWKVYHCFHIYIINIFLVMRGIGHHCFLIIKPAYISMDGILSVVIFRQDPP